MSRWTIYKSNGTERNIVWSVGDAAFGSNGADTKVTAFTSPSLEYSGTWMGDVFVTLNVRCAVPVDWEIGDYIIYRGEKFVMNYDPTVIKKARRGTYGEGFTYDNVKFNSLAYELTDVRMLDYVLFDNNIHYTSLPRFMFFCATVDDLCDRLQANTNRWCEENNYPETDYWTFITPAQSLYNNRSVLRCRKDENNTRPDLQAIVTRLQDEYYGGGTANEDEKVDQNVTVDNMSVWDCLKFIKDTFGLNFIIRGRSVIIGAMGSLTPSVFRYGKNNGLYEIERNADTDQAVITKLFAYGSDKNLPTRYYAELNSKVYAKVYQVVVERGGSVPYIDFTFDLVFMEKMFTNAQTVAEQTMYEINMQFVTENNEVINCKGVVEPNTDNRVYVHCSGAYTGDSAATINAFKSHVEEGAKIYLVGGINKSAFGGSNKDYAQDLLPDNMSVNRLMLPGFPTKSLYEWVITNGGTAIDQSTGKATWRGYTAYFSKNRHEPFVMSLNADAIGVREGTKYFDGSDDTKEIYPTLKDVVIDGIPMDELVAADMVSDSGVFGDGAEVPNTNVIIPDLGSDFDLKALLQSDTTISMTSGHCGGRDFSVKSVTKVENGWKCNVARVHDDALNLWFPYSYNASIGLTPTANEVYQLRSGDKYVLTGIEMTDAYVNANAIVLLEETLKFLAANDYVRYTYSPKIDEIYMARQHEQAQTTQGMSSMYMTLKEGDLMQFNDSDLHIEGSVYIDTLHIKEFGNGQIPTYEVTLRNDKAVGTIERIQQKVDSISSGGVTYGGGGGINVTQTRSLIENYGNELFLSKTHNDTAAGNIKFSKGLTSGTYIKDASGAMINAAGDAEFREIRGREALIVPEVRFELAKGVVGVETQCSCGGQIKEVFTEGIEDADGACTLMLEDGEIGRIEPGDLCMGVWHRKSDPMSSSSIDDIDLNENETSDDRKGTFKYQGFSTIYFRVEDVPAVDNNGESNADRHYFTYTLRPECNATQHQILDNGNADAVAQVLAIAGGNGIHPYPLMHFYGRGNSMMYEEAVIINEEVVHEVGEPVYPERQKFTLRTPEYTARLTDVNSWYFGSMNYTYVNGNLTGFENLLSELGEDPFGDKEPFGTIDCSLWMKGTIVQVPNSAEYLVISQSKLGMLKTSEEETVSFKVLDTYRNNKTNNYNYKFYRVDRINNQNLDIEITVSISYNRQHTLASFTLIYAYLNGTESATFKIIGTDKTDSTKTIEETFIVMRNTAAKGDDAVIYEIIPSETAFHIDKNDTLKPSDITFKIWKIEGLTRSNVTSSYLSSNKLLVDYGGEQYDTSFSMSNNSISIAANIDDAEIEELSGVTIRLYDSAIDHVSMSANAFYGYTSNNVRMDEIAVITIPVVVDGTDGVNVVVADFDDEMHSVACDKDGNPINFTTWTTVARMYLGNQQLTLTRATKVVSSIPGVTWSLTIISDGGYSNKACQLSVTSFGQTAAEEVVLRVELTAGTGDKATVACRLVKVRAGADGAGTTYNIITEPSVISVGYDNGTLVPKNCFQDTNGWYIKAYVSIIANGSTATTTDFGSIASPLAATAYLSDVSSSNQATVSGNKVYFQKNSYLVSGYHPLKLELTQTVSGTTKTLDLESVPVVKDGSDGIDGKEVTLVYNTDANKDQAGQYWHTSYQSGDVWARTKTVSSTGTSYGNRFRIVGEKGSSGQDADYIDYMFAISAYEVNSVEGNNSYPPSDCPANSNVWEDAPQIPTTEKPYLWMKRTEMDGTSGTQKANPIYVRVNGKDGEDGEDGTSNYTWIRYSDDGSTFTGNKYDGGLIPDSLLEEETVGSSLRNTNPSVNRLYGTYTNASGSGSYYGSNVVQNDTGVLNGVRRIKVTTGISSDYAIRQCLTGIKPSTWYTLEFYASAQNSYTIALVAGTGSGSTQRGLVDTTQKVIIDGVEKTVSSAYLYWQDSSNTAGSNDYNVNWKRHVISFKTYSVVTQDAYTYVGFTCSGRATYNFYFAKIGIREGIYDFSGENLLFNGDFREGVSSGIPRGYGNASTSISIVNIQDLDAIHTACQIYYPSGSEFIINFNSWQYCPYNDAIKSQTVTLSYYARKTGSSTCQLRSYQYNNSSSSLTSTLTTEWRRYEKTFVGGTASNSNIAFAATSGTTIQITGIKLEKGSSATPWSLNAESKDFGTIPGTWMGTLVWDYNYPSNIFSDYTWAKIKGDKGDNGGKGAKLRTRNFRKYSGEQPERGIQYCQGAEGEEWYDVVYYNSLAYLCISTYWTITPGTLQEPPAPGESGDTHWQLMNNFENVATKLLVADNGWVKSLSVQSLLAYDENTGRETEITPETFSITNKSNGTGVTIELDENGSPVIVLSDSQGTFAVLNRTFFSDSRGVGNTYTPVKLLKLNVSSAGSVTFNMVKRVMSTSCTVYYVFHEGYAMTGGSITSYNVSGTTTKSTVDGLYLRDNAAVARNQTQSSMNTAGRLIPNGFYVAANDGNLVYQMLENGYKRYTFNILQFTSSSPGRATNNLVQFDVLTNDTMDGLPVE